MVIGLDKELLPLAHPPAQFIGLARALRREDGLAEIPVCHPEEGIGGGEIRVKADSPPEQRHSGGEITLLCPRLHPQAERLKGFKRGGSGLLDGRIELLHRTERFAQLAVQLRAWLT